MARKAVMKVKKTKKVPMSRMAVKLSEQKGYGPEPEANVDYTKKPSFEYSMALNWYSRFIEVKDIDDIVAVTMKTQGFNAKQISAAKRSKMLTPTMASISTMLQRNCILNPDSMNWFRDRINYAITKGMVSKEAVIGDDNVINIQERTEKKALSFLGDIDEVIDAVWTKQLALADIKFFEMFTELGIKPAHAKTINEYYTNHLAEIDQYPADYSAETKKLLVPLYKKIVEVTGSWGAAKQPNSTKVRKPRTMSEASVAKKEAKQFNTFKYKASDETAGIVSIKPNSIIGTEVLITYNAKYKVATMYIALEGQHLDVKGTSILNFDEAKSVTKRVAKHMADIKQLSSATKAFTIKSFNGIKGSVIETRGRTSEDTLLVKAFK